MRLANVNRRNHNAQEAGDCRRPKDAAQTEVWQQQEGSHRSGNRAGRIHCLYETVSRTYPGPIYRSGDNDIARRATHTFFETVGKADEEYVPPGSRDSEQRLDCISSDIPENNNRFAACDPVSEISREKFGE